MFAFTYFSTFSYSIMLPISLAAQMSKIMKDAYKDCMSKSHSAAACLRDVVHGFKDDQRKLIIDQECSHGGTEYKRL
jgi:hypothetical protein